MVIYVIFSEVCSCIDDLFSVVIVNFGINIDYDVVNILIIVDGVVVVVEVIIEVVYLCVVVISQVMMRVGQMSINGVLFQVLDIGVCRWDVQCYVSVVGQFYLLQNNGVIVLFSLIGVCIQVSFVSSREGCVVVDVVYVDNFFIFVISDSVSVSCVVDMNFVVIGCSNNIVYRVVIQFSIVVYVVVIVDSQVIIRVYSNNIVIVVRFGSILGMVVYQISVQNVIVVMDIEYIRYYVIVMVSDVVAGQFQFVSMESFSIELINVYI